ncbi:streptomycin 3''-adenylyltransferase [Halobacillus andaensis]|uniref:Streptomycin 3''-adenylyltransferase n=1 Tax=Halobacillus andaensis TaxID=1176239 RepID=A0A917B5M2_HALAA|nr:aminoglycoside adenylyltransferase domain-containing protein [Halobacillus andaensis]MBP2004330.1 streptomycin 3'-adenylyltransferase [Halobacillus andaensis]GGF22480.1 streptomycin 3''-adenylyltransferase [Halobacillus andaensis]
MTYDWKNAPSKLKNFVWRLVQETKYILGDQPLGFYLHGSLAMGGFNPRRSDLDLLVITHHPISNETKARLAALFLKNSNDPYPIEISFLHQEQLHKSTHPFPFDFHYSEHWRAALSNDPSIFINEEIKTDPDLAAHIHIINQRGICLTGPPITEVFPEIPPADYLSSVMGDYEECIENIENDPIYCTLNMLRVLLYVKTGAAVSKEEAGEWGVISFPEKMSRTIEKALGSYRSDKPLYSFERKELLLFKHSIDRDVKELEAWN